MVTLVKHEWHQVDAQFAYELDSDTLSEIYPDLDEDEITNLMTQIENGEVDLEVLLQEAYDNNVEIEWDRQYDDWWTDRKGGYEVTFEVGDDNSWHTEPEPAPHTHKCTKCKWTGQSYDGEWKWQDDNGNELDDSIHVCPYCESHTELTEAGIREEKERAERQARWDKEAKDAEEPVPCFSCGAMHKESELPEMSGQYLCPDCHQGWVMLEFREEEEVDEEELARALEELKAEFEALTAHTHHCTECDWTGNESDHEKEGICPNCCAYTEKFNE